MGFTPLTAPLGNENTSFLGFFNGNNIGINNREVSLDISYDSINSVGLFSTLGAVNNTSPVQIGLSTLKNISVTGRVVGYTAVGGVVGLSYSSIIQNCTNYASVSQCKMYD